MPTQDEPTEVKKSPDPQPIEFLLGCVVMVLIFTGFVLYIGYDVGRGSVRKPVAVQEVSLEQDAASLGAARKIAALLDKHPEEWVNGGLGVDNLSRRIYIYNFRDKEHNPTDPSRLSVTFEGVELPGFDGKHGPTENQKIVSAAVERWYKITDEKNTQADIAERREALAKLQKMEE